MQFVLTNFSFADESQNLIDSAMSGRIEIEEEKPAEIKLDDSCNDPKIFAEYQSKRGCILGGDHNACAGLLFLGGVSAGSALAFAKKTFTKVAEPQLIKKVESVRDIVAKESETLREFNRVRSEIREKSMKMVDNRFEPDNATSEALMKKAIEANPNLKPYNIQYTDIKRVDGVLTPEQQQGMLYYDQVNKKISEVFKDEFSKLKPLYDQLERFTRGNHFDEMKKVRADIENLTKNNLNLKMANSVYEEIRYLRPFAYNDPVYNTYKAMKGVNEDLVRTKGSGSMEEIAKSEPVKVETKTTEMMSNQKAAGVALAGVMTLASFGVRFTGNKDVQSCKKELGLIDAEVSFLNKSDKEDPLLSPSRAGKTGQGCNTMAIDDPMETYNAAMKKFGGIPSGICKIIKKDSERLDRLVDNVSKFDVNCDKGFSSAKVKLENNILSYTTTIGDTLVAPYDQDYNYPSLKLAKIQDQSGKKLKGKTDEFVLKYVNAQGGSSSTGPQHSASDLINTCDQHGLITCDLAMSIADARIANSIMSMACPSSSTHVGGSEKEKKSQAEGVGFKN